LDLAETLRTDKEAKANLRDVYVVAGYQLEAMDGKKMWVYPHADRNRLSNPPSQIF